MVGIRTYRRQQFAFTFYQVSPVAVSQLFIIFLYCNVGLFDGRELPEPVLESSELISRFEQAASTKELAQRESQLADLANQHLADCNRVLLAWVTLHLDHVTACVSHTTEKHYSILSMNHGNFYIYFIGFNFFT